MEELVGVWGRDGDGRTEEEEEEGGRRLLLLLLLLLTAGSFLISLDDITP